MKYININGEEYPFKIGMNALSIIAKETGASLMDLGQNLSFEHILVIAYVGLREGARKEGSKFTKTKIETADLLDENPRAVKIILDNLSESLGFLTEEEAGEEKKI